MFEWIFSLQAWISLATLTSLEIVLGIDNIIFIAILCSKLPQSERAKARIIGLGFAMMSRIILLMSLFWIMQLTKPLFSIFMAEFSGRDLVLLIGGLFLIAKSTLEIHKEATGEESEQKPRFSSFWAVIIQIAVLDIVFSLDSVITAVGMADHIEIMIIAVILATFMMMIASGAIGRFVDKNPTIKILALAFLIMIGFTLVGDGLGMHIPKGYIYFAMLFSLCVEFINLYAKKR